MNENNEDIAPRRFRKRWVAWGFLLVWAAVGVWNMSKPMPPGTDVSTPAVAIDAANIRFLRDVTYGDPRGQVIHEQQIFDEIFRIIDESESFIIADFFLFNDMMGAAKAPHRALSHQLAERLMARKAAKPSLSILLITDPINDVYGGAQSALLDQLRAAGIDVVTTDLERLRDSNPLYSSLWRLFGQW